MRALSVGVYVDGGGVACGAEKRESDLYGSGVGAAEGSGGIDKGEIMGRLRRGMVRVGRTG